MTIVTICVNSPGPDPAAELKIVFARDPLALIICSRDFHLS